MTRTILFSTALIAGIVCVGVGPTKAAPHSVPAIGGFNVQVAPVEEVGYWRRRYYQGYWYARPRAYYPPAYGYYSPPYGYYAPRYPYYAPYVYRYYDAPY